MSETELPRIDPVRESAGLPKDAMPGPEEAADGLLPDEGSAGDDAGADVTRLAAELGVELPDDPDAVGRVLVHALAESQQAAGEYLEVMQRVAADFENYRKRVERDHAANVTRASQRLVERILPALDSFDAALTYEAHSTAEEKILDGMRGTHTQLLDILASEGLTAIPAAGESFDPALHEAVAGPPGDGEGPLVVAQELRRGYLMRGRVVRPSLVAVEHS